LRPLNALFLFFLIVLGTGAYVPVITGRQEVGVYRGSPVYRVTALQFLCCNQRLGDLTPEEVCAQFFLFLGFTVLPLLFEVSSFVFYGIHGGECGFISQFVLVNMRD
jgi:hypothetical protein